MVKRKARLFRAGMKRFGFAPYQRCEESIRIYRLITERVLSATNKADKVEIGNSRGKWEDGRCAPTRGRRSIGAPNRGWQNSSRKPAIGFRLDEVADFAKPGEGRGCGPTQVGLLHARTSRALGGVPS